MAPRGTVRSGRGGHVRTPVRTAFGRDRVLGHNETTTLDDDNLGCQSTRGRNSRVVQADCARIRILRETATRLGILSCSGAGLEVPNEGDAASNPIKIKNVHHEKTKSELQVEDWQKIGELTRKDL